MAAPSPTNTSAPHTCPADALVDGVRPLNEFIACYTPFQYGEADANISHIMDQCCGNKSVVARLTGSTSGTDCYHYCNVTSLSSDAAYTGKGLYDVQHCMYDLAYSNQNNTYNINCLPKLKSTSSSAMTATTISTLSLCLLVLSVSVGVLRG